MSIHWGGRGAGHINRLPRAIGALSPFSGATMLLDFTNPVLDPRITFSRGTGATRVNASGFIEVVGNTTPRFDYDPVTLVSRGLLIEEARTNLFLRSEEFDNASWSKLGSTISANATPSPDGTTNADALVEDTSTGSHAVFQSFSFVSGTSYTITVFAKASTRTRMNIICVTGLLVEANFDLSNGTVISTPAGTASITSFGNGWYRCQLSGVATATAAGNVQFRLISSGTTVSYTGDGTSRIFLYGAQLETGAFATSYIPTVASTVSRSADVATMTGTNFSSWYNQAAGTFVAEGVVAPNVDGAVGNYYYSASDGTISNMLLSAEVNGTVSQVIAGGVTQFNETVGGEPTGVLKVALAYQANNTVSSANGAIGTTDTSVTLPTVDRLGIGARGDLSAAAFLNGHIRTIAYFNTRLPNAQLQTLTAPSLATTLSLDFTSGSYNVGF